MKHIIYPDNSFKTIMFEYILPMLIIIAMVIFTAWALERINTRDKKKIIDFRIYSSKCKVESYVNYNTARNCIYWKHKPNYLAIGCEVRLFEQWDYFFSNRSTEVIITPRDSEYWLNTKQHYYDFKQYLIEQKYITV